MGDAIFRIILEKGGLLGALLLGSLVAVVYLYRVGKADRVERDAALAAERTSCTNERNAWNAERAALQKANADLQAARVEDAQKTRDAFVGVNERLVGGMALNTQALKDTQTALEVVNSRYTLDDRDRDEPTPARPRRPGDRR